MAINQATPSFSDASEIGQLVDMLRQRAAQHPDRTAYIFLADGEHEQGRLTFADLDLRAKAIAAHLQSRGLAGERALLVYDPGLDYIAAFYGCLYAGVIAVPVYPPDPLRFSRVLPRLMSIVEQADARVVLSSSEILAWSRQFFAKSPSVEHIMATEALASPGDEHGWLPPAIDGESIAFLQYTSGSGGDPKGVVLTHANLLANLEQMGRMHHDGASAVLWLPPYHDMGLIGGILLLAYRGCPMVLMPPLAFVQRPLRWLEAISRYRATSSGSPNFGYELCVKKIDLAECSGLDLSSWRLACNGSEPIRADTLERFYEKFAPYGLRREAFCPCYGLAEGTLMVSCARLDDPPVMRSFDAAAIAAHEVRPVPSSHADARVLVSSGRPVDDQPVVIVDPRTCTPCPPGRIGEIWASGPNIAQGYWNRPDESEGVFAGQLAGEDDASYLRTGDLGFLAEGELFVTGRIKDLIIVAGRNHYPQDIERTVEQVHPALKHDGGAAFSIDADGEERVVVVQEVLRPRKLNLEEIARQIRTTVAEAHELPVAAVVLISSGSLPKTSSGKVQRQACKQMYLAGDFAALACCRAEQSDDQPAEPPATGTEKMLARPWSELLGVAAPGRKDNFFACGGQSLLAMQLIGRIADEWRIDLPPSVLFEAPTLAELAARIDQAVEQNSSGRATSSGAIAPASRKGVIPLSFAQQRLWFLDRLEPANPFYNLPVAARLSGPLDVAALRRALDGLLCRHEALRFVFPSSGGQPHIEIREPEPIELTQFDLTCIVEPYQRERLNELLRDVARRPFDLARGPLFRAVLIRLHPCEHVLLLAMHHIVADGWSLDVLTREMSALYTAHCRGEPSPLAPLKLQYTDFAAWQREHLGGSRLDQHLNYWRTQLAELPPPVELPAGRASSQPVRFSGALESRLLPDALARDLDQASRSEGVTRFMVLLAALDALVHRYTGAEDIVIGSPIAGRTRPELEPLVGLFANMLPLRSDLSGDPTFRQLLQRVRNVALQAYANQDVPFDMLVEQVGGSCGRESPLFSVALVLQNALPIAQQGPLRVEPLLVDNGTAKYDLTLYCWPRPQALELVAEYSTDRFEQRTIARLLSGFELLLEAGIRHPDLPISQLPLLSDDDQRLLAEWSTGREEQISSTLLEMFARRVARSPEAIAVADARCSLTYRELDSRSNRLARYLQRLGVGPDVLVGLCLNRSCEMLVGLLGILKAGGAYVPLDPAYPQPRLAHMLADSGARVLITESRLADRLPKHEAIEVLLDTHWAEIERESGEPLIDRPPLEHLAYTIYTSGSTGQPKGVEITHGALASFLTSFSREPGLAPDDILLAVTTLSFDIAAMELFLPLVVGAQVVVAPREAALDGHALAELIEHSSATVMQATPATWRLLVEAGWQPRQKLKIICGGEVLRPDLAAELARRAITLWNVYGPTETTIWSTVHQVSPADCSPQCRSVPLGRPIANTRLCVLDRHRQLAPIGVPGELHIGGAGLARGYRDLPKLTSERFVVHPLADGPAGRLYRTGDRVRWNVDGQLEFLGRLDRQVKLRGHRIELGEIESLLATHAAIAEAAAVVSAQPGGEPRLLAYYSPLGRQPVDPDELRGWLKQQLPDYMLPAALIPLERLPRTPNGKLDRLRLPQPDRLACEPDAQHAPPASATEHALAGLWCELLETGPIWRHDNFFACGGHSLLAMRLVSRIEALWQIKLPVRSVFEAPILCELAARIDATGHEPADRVEALRIRPADRSQRLPLSFAQQRLWFLDRLEPGNPAYVLPVAARLKGPLDAGLLARSLAELLHRHEGLRTVFAERNGQPEQRVLPQVELDLEHVDLQSFAPQEREPALQRQMRVAARRPFDLAVGPLVRAMLFTLSEAEHVLLLVLHHIVADGWSLGVVLTDLAEIYRAVGCGEVVAAPPPIQYADFAVWQASTFADDTLQRQLAWWQEQLADLPPRLELPTDFPRPLAPRFTGGLVSRELPQTLRDQLQTASRAENVTLFMMLLAGFEAVLARYSGQTRFCVGTPIANRTRVELESVVGFCANTIALPAELDGNPTFREHLARVKQTALGAFAHQDLPLEKLVEQLSPERSRTHAPLFQVALVLQNAPLPLDRAGLRIEPLTVDNGTAKYDLTLFCSEHHGRLLLTAEYSDELFAPATVERMLASFECLLDAAVNEPTLRIGELPLASAQEQHLLKALNDTARDFPQDETLCGLLAESARRFADLPAVLDGGVSLTYGELERRAARVAEQLRSIGIRPGCRVAFCIERSPAMLVAILAILKTGAAYVPLEPGWPGRRLQQLVADADAAAIIIDMAAAEQLRPIDLPKVRIDGQDEFAGEPQPPTAQCPAQPDAPAYLIYTSGSTGEPKGVEVSHRALVNHACYLSERLELGPGVRVLQFISASFDAAAEEIFPALASGATLVLCPDEHRRGGRTLAAFCQQQKIDVWHLPTAVWKQLVDELIASGEPLTRPPRVLLVGGEAAEGATLQKWSQLTGRRGKLLHAYGLTEAGITSTLWETSLGVAPALAGQRLPIGKPIANTRVLVVDAFGQAALPGVAGELYVGGAGLALGYYCDPRLTAERFIYNPLRRVDANGFAGRFYRTGDRVRFLPDGNLEFLGRMDEQIKLHGLRIEPAEIESVLRSHSDVADVRVVARDAAGGRQLVAYVVPRRDSAAALTPAAEAQQVAHWHSVFEGTYRDAPAADEPTFQTVGWNSSYTGQPLPAHEMREWLDDTIQKIAQLRPEGLGRVLEIGCGTGMVLFRLAGQASEYWATDFSAASLAHIQRTLCMFKRPPAVVLRQQAADDFTGFEGPFDVVVLNSVVQYFASADYLARVLMGAAQLVKPGGVIFVGDVRSYALLPALCASVELDRAADDLPLSELRERVGRRIEREQELCVAPAMFTALAGALPQPAWAETRLKRAKDDNELTRFRYDVVLHVGEADPAVAATLDWTKQIASIERLRECLRNHRSGRLRVRGIPNGRVHRAVLAWKRICDGEENVTAGQLRGEFKAAEATAIDPESISELAQACGVEVQLGFDEADEAGAIDAIFTCTGAAQNVRTPKPQLLQPARRSVAWSRYATDPLKGLVAARLVPELRSQLAAQLPAAWMPSAFVLLEQLPLTAGGKLDRRALPAPALARPDWSGAVAGPRSPTEAHLVRIWEELLRVQPVGVHDDFFELGGHSMLAVKMVAAAEQACGRQLPLAVLFERRTIAELAELLERPHSAVEASCLVPLDTTGEGPPLFLIHPAGGTVFCYRELCAAISGSRPVYGLQAQGLDGRHPPLTRIQDMAAHYLNAIRRLQPQGPFSLCGWSLGGNIAYEIACQLAEQGERPGLLVLLDAGAQPPDRAADDADFVAMLTSLFPGEQQLSLADLRKLRPDEQLDYFVRRAGEAQLVPTDAELRTSARHVFEVFQSNVRAIADYRPQSYAGPVKIVKASRPMADLPSAPTDDALGWQPYVSGPIELQSVAADHVHMLTGESALQIAAILQ